MIRVLNIWGIKFLNNGTKEVPKYQYRIKMKELITTISPFIFVNSIYVIFFKDIRSDFKCFFASCIRITLDIGCKIIAVIGSFYISDKPAVDILSVDTTGSSFSVEITIRCTGNFYSIFNRKYILGI